MEAELATDPEYQRQQAAAAAGKAAADTRRLEAQRAANANIVRSSSKRAEDWIPPSQRSGSQSGGTQLTDIASTFDATRAKPAPIKKVAKVPKVRAAQTLGTSSVFMVQQSTMLAEEAHLERLGDGETDKVHPSQMTTEEALPELVPKWRLKQIEELEAERNDTSDLSRREKARVKKRLQSKRAKQKAIEQAIQAGLPEFDDLLGAADDGNDGDGDGGDGGSAVGSGTKEVLADLDENEANF